MTFFVENETDIELKGVETEEIFESVVRKTLELLDCPYEAEVNLTLTDSDRIHSMNREFRDVDAPTDVLSFPMLQLQPPADFSALKGDEPDFFDPDTHELLLGDIVINLERVISQAESYGHSQKREYAFLIVHSMLHLLGFDHMTPEEESVMFAHQDRILNDLDINR